MKRKNAKEILAESFRELAESMPVDRITIQDIADNCGYSPATFYRNYKDKYDLIAWEYAGESFKIMNRIDGADYPWEKTLLDAALRFENEKAYLLNLFTHTTGQDSFIRYMTDLHHDILKAHILSSNGIKDIDEKTEMYIRIYCLGTVSLVCEWIFGKYKAKPEELAEIFKNSLPQPLQGYLLKK